MKKFVILICSLFTTSTLAFGADATVDLMDGYRSWQHVKTMIIQPGHPLEGPFGGIHHVYANPKAMAGMAEGTYENGAVFVFDLLDYQESDNTLVEADRKRLDVMRYDKTAFSATGGWDFASFLPKSKQRVEQDVNEACFKCHASKAASSYVFSRYRP